MAIQQPDPSAVFLVPSGGDAYHRIHANNQVIQGTLTSLASIDKPGRVTYIQGQGGEPGAFHLAAVNTTGTLHAIGKDLIAGKAPSAFKRVENKRPIATESFRITKESLWSLENSLEALLNEFSSIKLHEIDRADVVKIAKEMNTLIIKMRSANFGLKFINHAYEGLEDKKSLYNIVERFEHLIARAEDIKKAIVDIEKTKEGVFISEPSNLQAVINMLTSLQKLNSGLIKYDRVNQQFISFLPPSGEDLDSSDYEMVNISEALPAPKTPEAVTQAQHPEQWTDTIQKWGQFAVKKAVFTVKSGATDVKMWFQKDTQTVIEALMLLKFEIERIANSSDTQQPLPVVEVYTLLMKLNQLKQKLGEAKKPLEDVLKYYTANYPESHRIPATIKYFDIASLEKNLDAAIKKLKAEAVKK